MPKITMHEVMTAEECALQEFHRPPHKMMDNNGHYAYASLLLSAEIVYYELSYPGHDNPMTVF
jgi:hypothetical protein